MRKILFLLILGIFLIPNLTSTAQAVDIVEGDLIRASDGIDVWIVKYIGAKKFKRLILNPDVFNMYGHLNWGDIKVIDKSIVNSFTESTLIRAVGDEKVYKLYPAGDTGKKRWIKTAEIFLAWGFDWDAVYTINEFDRDSYVIDTPFESSPVGLAPTTPVLEDPGTSISSGTLFTIVWSAPENTTSYTLQRDTNSSFTNPTAVYTGSNATTVDNRTPSTPTNYYYRVKASNANGDSSWSNVVDVQITTEGVPSAPTFIDPGTSVAAGISFTLTWSAVSNVSVYVLEQDTNSSFSSPTTITSADASTISYSHALTPSATTTYYWRIQARNNIGHSSWSNVVSMQITVGCALPNAPVLSDPGSTRLANTLFNLIWTSVQGATSYTWEYDINSSFTSASSTGAGAAISASVNHAAADTYYYRVKTANSCGDSVWSNVVDLTITEPEPVPQTYNVPSDYATIQAAINAAPSNTTINVSAGTYNESITMKDGIVLKSVTGPTNTIINGVPTQWGSIVTVAFQDVSNATTIEGFTIKAITNNGQSYCIQVESDASPLIKNNLLIAGTWQAYAIVVTGNANTKPTIVNNTIIATDNANATCAVCSMGGDPTVINNIMVGDNSRESTAIDVGNNAYPTVHKYNYMYNFKLGINASYDDPSTSRPLGTGSVLTYTVPGFVNSGAGDYHLQSTSPAVDAGDPTYAYSSEPSPNGSRINMGVYGNTSEATESSDGATLGQYAGPDTSSHGVELTNFSVSGNNSVNGTITAKFTFRNTNSYALDFTPYGILVGCRNPSWVNKDFGSTGVLSLAAGESKTLTASRTVDTVGTWRFWPAYYVNSSWGPYRWHEITVDVSN